VLRTTRFKQLLHAPEILVLPGVPDPLCARIAEQAGFQAVVASGYANSAAHLGVPDVGLLTLTEMVDCVWRIADATTLPVFVDGDTGHGNVSNVGRSMRQFEKAGAAAIFFEDQVAPKRCGHMAGKQVVEPEEMVARIRGAVDARTDPDLQIMARTDALALHGLDDALDRMHRYLKAGADWAFIEAPGSVEELRRIACDTPAPSLANMIPGGRTPLLPASALQEIGFAAVAYPTLLTYALARTAVDVLESLHASSSTDGLEARLISFDQFNELVGLPELRAWEARQAG
jgi:2-methylisocitrate lyase-like PEP mutase family enzyme